MIALPETFACPHITSLKVTRHGCASRHERAKNGGRVPGARTNERVVFAKDCERCEVGAAHARGERPDVTIASTVARVTETKNEEGVMPKVTMIEHGGETKPLGAWADQAGLGRETLRKRLAAGMSMKDALTKTPGRGGRPKVAEPTKATQARREQRARAKAPLDATVEATRGVRGPLPRLLDVARAKGVAERAIVEMGSADHAAEVLARLGYDVEDAGIVPAGRLILVRTPHAAQVRA